MVKDISNALFSLRIGKPKDNVLVTFGWGEFSGNLPPVGMGGHTLILV
jgi:hypothetical protein